MGEFYFPSYNRVIGVAFDLAELEREIDRLAWENPTAVLYHLRRGHISSWLESIGERELGVELRTVTTIEEAQRKIERYRERSTITLQMHMGHMR